MRTIAVAAVLVAAVAAGAPSAPEAKSTLVIRLVSITTSNRLQDKPPQGASVGDKILTTSRLLNAVAQFGRAKGATVGSDRASITVVAPDALLADGTATLPGGTIRFHGRITAQSSGTVPVTGGTGRFAGAKGTLTTASIRTDMLRASNVYRLTLP